MPNTYARGILFGKMLLELCDVSSIANAKNDFHCDVDFKAKVRTSSPDLPVWLIRWILRDGYRVVTT